MLNREEERKEEEEREKKIRRSVGALKPLRTRDSRGDERERETREDRQKGDGEKRKVNMNAAEESHVEAKGACAGCAKTSGSDAKRQKTCESVSSAPQGKEEALVRLRSLHIQMRDLEQEMKVFENAVLPVDSVKEELRNHKEKDMSVNDFCQECMNKLGIELAKEYDVLRNEFSKGFTQHVHLTTEGDMYQLPSTISSAYSKHARWVVYLCCILGNTPQWISADKYCMSYDTIEADYPFVHEHIGVFLNASSYLLIIQDEKLSAQFHFDDRQKMAFKKCYAMVSRLEDMLSLVVNSAYKIDESLAMLSKTYLQSAVESPSEAAAKDAQSIQNMMKEINEIQESLIGGVPIASSASKGEVLGLIAFKCICQALIWLQGELHLSTFVLSRSGTKSAPLLNPLQSAASMIHVTRACIKERTKDILYKTASVAQESGPENNKGGLQA